jgi:hypothetical protein
MNITGELMKTQVIRHEDVDKIVLELDMLELHMRRLADAHMSHKARIEVIEELADKLRWTSTKLSGLSDDSIPF